jgi:hypothetical protein
LDNIKINVGVVWEGVEWIRLAPESEQQQQQQQQGLVNTVMNLQAE